MAIDPIAVTGGAAAKMPVDTDIAAQGHAAPNAAQEPHAAAGSSEAVDLFDYASQQNQRSLPLNALSAEGKAQHFANPNTLGEEVLNYIEGFHQRTSHAEPLSGRFATSETATAMQASTGPASMMPTATSTSSLSAVGSTGTGQASAADARFEMVLKVMEEAGFRHTETNLVSNVGQQFSKAMNTLMRGQ